MVSAQPGSERGVLIDQGSWLGKPSLKNGNASLAVKLGSMQDKFKSEFDKHLAFCRKKF